MVRIRYFWAAMPPEDDARSVMPIRWFPNPPGDVPLRNRFSWRKAPLAPPLGELLSECEAEGVQYIEWYSPKFSEFLAF